jgi:hypothetical protein
LTLGGEGNRMINWFKRWMFDAFLDGWMDCFDWCPLEVHHHICTFYIAHIGGQFIAFWLWANCVKLLWLWWCRCNNLVRAMEMTKLLGKEEQVMNECPIWNDRNFGK